MADGTRDIEAHLRHQVVPQGASRHGLVIGIETYRDTRLNLRCARADAQAIYTLMTDPDCGMFPKENVRLLLDEEATRHNIWRALSALHRAAGEDDTVWIYYAGHAAPEEASFYWVTYDADVDELYGTALSNDQISRALNDIRARRLVVILDCCHAAATSMQKNPTRAMPTAEDVFAAYKGQGRVTLSSSDGREKSVELSDVGHGAFTYFLERGLRGEADTDADGVVTADELWAYLRRRVAEASRTAGNPQTPILTGEMSHDLPLALNPTATGRKKEIAEAIERLIGLGEDRLATEEALLCLEVLRRGPHNPAERELARQLDRGPDGLPEPRILKVLAMAALQSPAAPPPGPPPLKPSPRPEEPQAERPAPQPEPLLVEPLHPLPPAAEPVPFPAAQEPPRAEPAHIVRPWEPPRPQPPEPAAVDLLEVVPEGPAVHPGRRPAPPRAKHAARVLVGVGVLIVGLISAAVGLYFASEGQRHTPHYTPTWKPSGPSETPPDNGPVVTLPDDSADYVLRLRMDTVQSGRRRALEIMARSQFILGMRRAFVMPMTYAHLTGVVTPMQAMAIQSAVRRDLDAALRSQGAMVVEGTFAPPMFVTGDAVATLLLMTCVRNGPALEGSVRIQILAPGAPPRPMWTGDAEFLEDMRGK